MEGKVVSRPRATPCCLPGEALGTEKKITENLLFSCPAVLSTYGSVEALWTFPVNTWGPRRRGARGLCFLQDSCSPGQTPLLWLSRDERVRSGLPAKEQRDPQGADYAPDAFTSNCLLMHILNIKQVTLADGEATTSDPLGGLHLFTYAFCKRKADTPSRFNDTIPEEPKTVKTSIKGKGEQKGTPNVPSIYPDINNYNFHPLPTI